MKKAVVLIFVFMSAYSFSQTGKMIPKNPVIKQGELNTYVYTPPTGILVSENAVVNIYYMPYVNRTVPLIKNDSGYEFSIVVPDSIPFLMMTVLDQKKKTIDDHSGKGYTIYLKEGSKEELAKAKLSKSAYSEVANRYLKLTITPEEMISQFEELYAQYPSFKEENSYLSYLYLKCQKDTSMKPEALKCAERFIKKGDEQSLIEAMMIYQWFNRYDRCNEIDTLAVKKYPKGWFARNNFYNEFSRHPDRTEKYILDKMNQFTTEFADTTYKARSPFLYQLLVLYVKNEDTLNIRKYASLLKDKQMVASLYNNRAWELSGQDLTSPGKDLPYAVSLSKQSVDILREALKHSDDTNVRELTSAYVMYADTYALLMYKQKNYEQAFQTQDELSRMEDIDAGGKERYAAYAEKAKGPEFARSYIESQLNDGVDSKIMIHQLQLIYAKLNLPLSDFERINANFEKLSNKKLKDEIIKRYGSLAAFDFTLTNMQGEKVQLSSYKGKMVVLDFWATWCGPCRASFPKMQELVNMYKDKNVAFFFIDVWERKTPDETKVTVDKFIQDNHYGFNVLYDFKNEVGTKYKINSIPAKIIIDKNGDILSMETSIDDIPGIIDKNI